MYLQRNVLRSRHPENIGKDAVNDDEKYRLALVVTDGGSGLNLRGKGHSLFVSGSLHWPAELSVTCPVKRR